jgi:hypothetical protein
MNIAIMVDFPLPVVPRTAVWRGNTDFLPEDSDRNIFVSNDGPKADMLLVATAET